MSQDEEDTPRPRWQSNLIALLLLIPLVILLVALTFGLISTAYSRSGWMSSYDQLAGIGELTKALFFGLWPVGFLVGIATIIGCFGMGRPWLVPLIGAGVLVAMWLLAVIVMEIPPAPTGG